MDIAEIVPQLNTLDESITPIVRSPDAEIPRNAASMLGPSQESIDKITQFSRSSSDIIADGTNAIKRLSLDVDISDASREMSDLANQVRAYGENDIIPQDLMDSYVLQKQIKDDLATQAEQLNNGKVVQGVSAAYTSARDTLIDVKKNPLLVATGTAAGVAAGAPSGVGTIATGLYGFAVGAGAASFKENVNRMSGEAYVDMDFAADDQGKPIYIPNAVKNDIADAVGLVGASIEFGGDILGAKLLPIFKPLTGLVGKQGGKLAAKYMTNETTRKGLTLAAGLLKSGSAEAITELTQEVFKDAGTTGAEGAQEDQGTLDTLLKGFGRLADTLSKGDEKSKALIEKYKDVAIISAIAGGAFHATGTAASKVRETTMYKAADAILDRELVKARESGAKFKAIKDRIAERKQAKEADTDSSGYVKVKPDDGVKTNYQLEVLDAVLEQGNSKLDPKGALDLKTSILAEAGVTAFYADPKDLQAVINTPMHQKVFGEIVDANSFDMSTESKVKLTPQQALTLMADIKELKGILTATPEGLTFNEALALREDTQVKAEKALGTQRATTAPKVAVNEESLPAISTELNTEGINEATPNAGDTAAALQYEQHKLEYIRNLNEERAAILTQHDQGAMTKDSNNRLSQIDTMIESLNLWQQDMNLATDETQVIPEGPEITDYEKSEAVISNYIKGPKITDFVKQGISYAEFQRIEKLINAAREQQADKARVIRSNEYDRMLNSAEEIDKLEQDLADIEEAKNDPDIQIVENFMKDRKNNVISFETLTDEQKAMVNKEPLLQSRKVFNKKKGADINQVALKYGLSPEQLLHVLANAPDRKTAIRESAAIRKELLKLDTYATLDANLAVVNTYFDNVQKLKLDAIKSMFAQDAKGTARVISSVLDSIPDLKVIKSEVTAALANVRSSDLNPKKYRNAAAIASVKARKAALAGDFIQSARLREVELRNLEFERQAVVTIAKSNTLVKNIIKRSKNPSIVGLLKKSGKYDAMLELSEVFNMTRRTGTATEGSILKWAKDVETKKIGNDPIPESLRDNYDSRLQLSDLSVTQLEALSNLQAQIISDAERTQSQKQAEKDVMMSEIRDTFSELRNHKKYDADNLVTSGQDGGHPNGWLKNKYLTVVSGMNNINHTLKFLTDGDLSSSIYDLIYNQLKGLGSYANSKYGERKHDELLRTSMARQAEILERYGGAEYEKYFNERVSSNLLEGTDGILGTDGKVSRYEIMALVAYAGTKNGMDRMANYNISEKGAIMLLAKEHLTKKDIEYIHEAMYDQFKLFQPYVTDYLKDLNQAEVAFQEGETFEVFGKVWDGGYIPFYYRNEQSIALAAHKVDQQVSDITQGSGIYISEAALNMTSQRNTNEQVTSFGGLLNLNPSEIIARGTTDVVRDVTMHVPMRNVMDILLDETISTNIQGVIGSQGLESLRHNVLSVGNNIYSDNFKLHSRAERLANSVLAKMGQLFVRNTLVISGATSLVQFASVPALLHQMGLRGSRKFTSNILKTILNTASTNSAAVYISNVLGVQGLLTKSEVARVAEFDASTRDFAALMMGKTSNAIKNAPDFNNKSKLGRVGKSINESIDIAGFGLMLGSVDSIIKTASINTHIELFMEGRAKDYDYSKLDGMTPEEYYNAAMAYAVTKTLQVVPSPSAIETAVIQKGSLKDWARLFGDARNLFSIINYEYSKIASDGKVILKGDTEKTRVKAMYDIVKRYGVLHAMIATQLMFISAVRGYDDEGKLPDFFEDEDSWVPNKEYFQRILDSWVNNMKPWAAGEMVAEGIPLLRSLLYSVNTNADTGGRVKPVVGDMPTSALNNLADAIAIMVKVAGDSYDYWDATGEVEVQTPKNTRKRLLKGAGSFLPIPYRLIEGILSSIPEDTDFDSVTDSLSGLFEKSSEIQKDAQQMIFDNMTNEGAEEDIAELQDVLNQIDPQDMAMQRMIANGEVSVLNPEDYDLIAMAESSGNPNAQAQGSSAKGLYQFTDDTWTGLMAEYPELELTIDGRTDPEEAQRAMEFTAGLYAQGLLQNEIPVNIENIYAMHHFGEDKAISILSLPDDAELPNLAKERKANPWMNGNVSWVNNGEEVTTVGEFKQAIADLLYNKS